MFTSNSDAFHETLTTTKFCVFNSDEHDISENTDDNFTHVSLYSILSNHFWILILKEKLHSSFGAVDEDEYMSFNSSSDNKDMIPSDKSCK